MNTVPEKSIDCEQADQPTQEELADSETAWKAWLNGEDEGEPLEKVKKDLLCWVTNT